jgi:hypothetical protein
MQQATALLQWAKDGGMKGFRLKIKEGTGVNDKPLLDTTITVGQSTPEDLAQMIATKGATIVDAEPVNNPKGLKRRVEPIVKSGGAPPKAPGQEAEAPAAGLPTNTPEIPDWFDGVLDRAVRKVPPSLREDARQEVAAEAFKALERFDPSKSQADQQAFVNQRAQGAAVDFMRRNSKLERGVTRGEANRAEAAGEETPQSKFVPMPEAAEDIFRSHQLSPEEMAQLNEKIEAIIAERGGTPPPKPPEEPEPKGRKPVKPPLKRE